jgi:hypothetical protein
MDQRPELGQGLRLGQYPNCEEGDMTDSKTPGVLASLEIASPNRSPWDLSSGPRDSISKIADRLSRRERLR